MAEDIFTIVDKIGRKEGILDSTIPEYTLQINILWLTSQ